MQFVSFNPLIASFQLSYAASLNSGWSQNDVLGKGLKILHVKRPVYLLEKERFLWIPNYGGSFSCKTGQGCTLSPLLIDNSSHIIRHEKHRVKNSKRKNVNLQ